MGTSAKPFFRRARMVLICTTGVFLIAGLEPHLLRFALKRGAILKAARHGVTLTIGKVEGSIFEPIVFRDIAFSSTKQGVSSSTKAAKAEARLAWSAIVLHRGAGFFDRLLLERVKSEIAFTRDTRNTRPPASEPEEKPKRGLWLPVPSHLEIREGSLAFHTGAGKLVASDVDCTLSGIEPGAIRIGELTIDQGRLRRTFDRVSGTTGRQETRLVFADIQLAPGLWLKSLSSDAADPAGSVSFEFAAFGGAIRGELTNSSRSNRPVYEINGNFHQISVPELAEFLEVPEKTGGIIEEGKFTFRGSPHAWEKAAVSTRLEAVDFLWGNRQWNSLVLGATIINRRVEIPELRLRQAHNALSLKGEILLPPDETPWWESDNFHFDIAAKIDNLTELSALFGPPFSDTAGKATVDGSIRGQKKNFSGQLLVTGSGLRYREAPIEILNAGIKLEGNEIQILNFELANGTDFIRGKGVVNILGEKRYWGEINASVAELDLYRPLLEKPIAPAPLTGGLAVNWSGDGTLQAHSGAFSARFRKLRTPGADGIPPTLPIDADLEGTYAPGSLFLSQCRLAHAETRLETRLAADRSTLKLEDLKLTQKNALWLEGNAVLPVNLWQWWQSPGVAALAPTAPFKVGLTARGVQLDEVGRLTGRPIPFSGILSGPVSIEGTLRRVEMTGSLKLAKGNIPANGWLPSLEEVEAEAELDGRIVRFSHLRARHAAGLFTGSGAVDFTRFETPAFELVVQGERITFATEDGAWSGDAAVDLSVSGTREAATVNGTALLIALKTAPIPDFGPLISHFRGETLRMAPPAFRLPATTQGWRFDVGVTTASPVALPHGKSDLEADLRFASPAKSSPFLPASGDVTYLRLPAKTEFATGTVETATLHWTRPDTAPTLAARVAAKVAGASFIGYFVGPVDRPAFTYVSEPSIEEERLRLLLAEGFAPLPPEAAEFNPELAAPFNAPISPAQNAEPAADPPPPTADPAP